MSPLSTCWLLIELYVIPDGFLKWFYLSFYIHPSLLVFCQLYLWIKVLLRFLLTIILFGYRNTCFSISHVLRFLKFFVLFSKKFIVPNRNNPIVIEEVVEEEYYEIPDTMNQNEIVLHKSLSVRNKSHGMVNLDRTSTKSYDMIHTYDFQTRVAQMFANNQKIIGSCLEQNCDESMELDKWHEEVPSGVVDSYDNEEMNIFGDCTSTSTVDFLKTDPLSHGSILCDTKLELEFSQSNSACSSPEDIQSRLDEYSLSTSSSNSSPLNYITFNENSPSISYTNAMEVADHQLDHDTSRDDEEEDVLYKKYAERMSWFDVLNHDTLCAISAVLGKHLSSSNLFELKMEPTSLPVQYISWSKVARKRLVKSLESDLELVYVAQSCLSWEALHHQYKKVEALCSSNAKNQVFYGNVAARFQKFQILLERFVEDDSSGGKRHSNYAHRRFSLKNLLQVPDVSGDVGSMERLIYGETSNIIQVLKAIEKCINAFWFYVRADEKTSWKRNNLSWSTSPVEDPRDIWLLHDVTKMLQMKELWLKDVKGKRKCWLRRTLKKPQQQDQLRTKIEFVFTLIEMKLVSRVLHMSMISTSHLKWCQHKLNNIEFKDGQILRTPTSLLFPS